MIFSEGAPSEAASSEGAGRKLAFHEPRPCPTCQVTIAWLITKYRKLCIASKRVKCVLNIVTMTLFLFESFYPAMMELFQRMYRDAATLRTHTAIMHSEGPEPFR